MTEKLTKTIAHKEVERLLGREVNYGIKLDHNHGKCADCKKTARYSVVEKSKQIHDAWYYCGRCMVG